MDWELGAGSPYRGKVSLQHPADPLHRSLCAHAAPFPTNPQADVLCHHRLLSLLLWARRSTPPVGLGGTSSWEEAGIGGGSVQLMVVPGARGQSVVRVCVRVHTHALLGKSA